MILACACLAQCLMNVWTQFIRTFLDSYGRYSREGSSGHQISEGKAWHLVQQPAAKSKVLLKCRNFRPAVASYEPVQPGSFYKSQGACCCVLGDGHDC